MYFLILAKTKTRTIYKYKFSSFCFLFSFEAMEVGDQDEILFEDLNKQIALLIMDDDADQYLPYPPVTYQVYSPVVEPITQPAAQLVFHYKQSKGTGVFIPRLTHRRRKSKQERLNTNHNYAATSNNTREYSPNNSKDLILPQPQFASKNYETYSSFNHKRI